MRQEVWDCLQAMGLHSGSIRDCSQLSREIHYYTGRKISASTLYRMLNPVSQRVVPSSYSRATIAAFWEVVQRADFQAEIGGELRGQIEVKASALHAFVLQEFQRETDGFEDWFTALPEEHWATGREQVVIGQALATGLAAGPKVLRSKWKQRLFLTPQFRTFYTETYVDLNAPKSAYLELLRIQFEALNRAWRVVGNAPAKSTLESLVFNVAIQGLLWFLIGNQKEMERMRTYTKSATYQAIRSELPVAGILPHTRLLCMEWLLFPSDMSRSERLQEIRAELKAHFERVINPQLREFAYCILIDTLLLQRDIEGAVHVLSDVPAPRITFLRSEPSIHRMSTYRKLFEGSQGEGELEALEGPLAVGANESTFSELMMLLARRLKSDVPRLHEAKPLIHRSGFTHFEALLR